MDTKRDKDYLENILKKKKFCIKKLLIFRTGFRFHIAKQALKNGWNVSSISKKKKERYLKGLKYYFCNISNKKLDKILNQIRFHHQL